MSIEITNEDNMDLMARSQNNEFDLADCDPPYFSGPEKRGYYGNKISTHKVKRIDYPITDTWYLPSKDWYDEVCRVSKNQIIWGANYFEFIGKPFKTPRGNEINDFIKDNPIGWIIWDKCNGGSSFNDYELAWTSYDKPTVVFVFMWSGMMQGKSLTEGHIMQGNKSLNQKKIHPTEKPIILYDWVHLNYMEKGQKKLSTHVGSASDAISSLKFDIDFYGCEISKINYTNAIKRLDNHRAQIRMF